VIALRPARSGRAVPADGSLAGPVAAGGRANGAAPGTRSLVGGLRRWRGRIGRRRVLAVVRRALLVAAPFAVVVVAVGRDGALPVWVMVAAPLAVALGVCAVAARHRLDLPAVAHLLDDRLGLAEVVGTGLELETAPRRAENRLDARVRALASDAVGETLGGSRAVARRAPREWALLAVAAVAIAALAVTGSTGGNGGALAARRGSGHGAAAGPGAGSRSGSGMRRPGAGRLHRASGAGALPTGRPYDPYANRHETSYQRALARQAAEHPQLSYTAPGLRPDLANAGAPTGRSTRSGSANAGGNSSPPTAQTAPSPGSATQAPPSSGVAPVGSRSTAGGGGGGSASAGQQQHAAAPPGTPGSASSPPNGGGAAQSGQAGQSGAHGGAPTGGTEAGHTRGTTQAGTNAPPQLSAGPEGLPLQGGYEPGRPGGRAQAGNTGGGGGGHSRDRGISGGVASSPNGGAFPYIPPDVAAIPGAQQGLLTDYLDVLRSLSGRSW